MEGLSRVPSTLGSQPESFCSYSGLPALDGERLVTPSAFLTPSARMIVAFDPSHPSPARVISPRPEDPGGEDQQKRRVGLIHLLAFPAVLRLHRSLGSQT